MQVPFATLLTDTLRYCLQQFAALHHGGSTASNASARSYQADSSYSNWASGSPSYRPGSAPQPPPPPGAGQVRSLPADACCCCAGVALLWQHAC